MASAEDLDFVKKNIGEVDTTVYSDPVLGAYIDSLGKEAAIAFVWDAKAAGYAELVTVSEAGASRALSDLHKNAAGMADRWRARAVGNTDGVQHAKTYPITR